MRVNLDKHSENIKNIILIKVKYEFNIIVKECNRKFDIWNIIVNNNLLNF